MSSSHPYSSQARPRSPFYLPLFSSSSNSSRPAQDAAHPALYTFLAPLFLRKSRFSIILSILVVSLVLYFVLLGDTTALTSRLGLHQPTLSGLEKGILVGDVQEARGGGRSRRPEEPNVALPIREEPHPNPHIPLPEETVFDNPWPDDPDIVKHWLNDERLASVPFEPPDWSTLLDKQAPGKLLNRLPKSEMVHWKDFWRPRGYKAAKLVEDTSPSTWPKIQKQGSFEESAHDIKIRQARREWVRRAFMHAWTGYKSKAWGYDEIKPISGKSSNPFNAWGATIVDSLSTLLVMNLTDEYSLARTHVRQIDFTTVLGERSAYGAKGQDGKEVPVFETIIRYLGGLISAYDLTDGKDLLMLERAEELAGWLMGAFEWAKFSILYGVPG